MPYLAAAGVGHFDRAIIPSHSGHECGNCTLAAVSKRSDFNIGIGKYTLLSPAAALPACNEVSLPLNESIAITVFIS